MEETLARKVNEGNPDPSWDYYTVWGKLSEVRDRIITLMAYVAQQESASYDADNGIQVESENLAEELQEVSQILDGK